MNPDVENLPPEAPATAKHTSAQTSALTVLYDGSCPLCRREIGVYRDLKASQSLCFVDVCDPGLKVPAGTRPETLKARFHVQHADGRMESGARAFLALWAVLPGWRWLARLGALPGVAFLMECTYRAFLRVRPGMQGMARRWEQRQAAIASVTLEPSSTTTSSCPLPRQVITELRTDHAGETGAVMIYRGVLAVTRDPHLREFAQHHLETERRHLALIEQVLPAPGRSKLLPLWRLSGWLTGALPACAGPRAVYATIQAVETFVDRHYADQVAQIDTLLSAAASARPPNATPTQEDTAALISLRALLEQCRLDEVAHRDDAASRWDRSPSGLIRLWQALVGLGSAWAVSLCRLL